MTNPFAAAQPAAAANPFQQAAPAAQPAAAAPVAQPAFQAPAAQPATQDAFASPGQDAPAGDPFGAPSGGGEHNLTDYLGELVLVTPTEWIESMPTKKGPTSAMRVDFVVLTGPSQGLEASDALVFQVVLKKDLKNIQRKGIPMLLGRMAKGEERNGNSAPWLFVEATEDDKVLARQWLAHKAQA